MNVGFVIIGGGIAGLSLAAELGQRLRGTQRVVLLEAEASLAQHTSARSAQQLIPSYGPEPVIELTKLSIPALLNPDGARPVSPTSSLAWPSRFMVVGTDQEVAAAMAPGMRYVDGQEVLTLAPELRRRPERYLCGLVDESSVRTDAAALIAWHRECAVRAGVRIQTSTTVTGGRYEQGAWTLELSNPELTTVRSRVVINAAGAWADGVAERLGVRAQGLVPKRRTAAYVNLSKPMPAEHPMVNHAVEEWYYRPEGTGALISWGEAEVSEPCDAQPHPGHVAALINLLQAETDLEITGIRSSWTGLRTETASDIPLCGWDPDTENFLWLAGQGGYGFQTSVAMAQAATDLLLHGEIQEWLSAETANALRCPR